MKILDISQEVFGCAVWPGDPAPERIMLSRIRDGAACNVTALKMCAHNGTHADAPCHFLEHRESIGRIPLDRFVGYAYVSSHEGGLSAADAESVLRRAQAVSADSGIPGCDGFRRILIRGDAMVTEEAAEVFAGCGIYLIGNESQSVGPENAPMAVHRILLGGGTVLLEGIRLREAGDGLYFLNAAPLNLDGADGAPCRAWLIPAGEL